MIDDELEREHVLLLWAEARIARQRAEAQLEYFERVALFGEDVADADGNGYWCWW